MTPAQIIIISLVVIDDADGRGDGVGSDDGVGGCVVGLSDGDCAGAVVVMVVVLVLWW